MEWAEAVIYRQKFEGAAADMLNQAIIARELGLVDRKEMTGLGGGPLITVIEIVAATDGESTDQASA